MSQTMRQVINVPGPTVRAQLTTGHIPLPDAKQVLIKVIVSGCDPKDWKVPELAADYSNADDGTFMAKAKAGINQGDDIAGIVEAVGKDVIEFKVRGYLGGSYHVSLTPSRKAIVLRLSMRWELQVAPMRNMLSPGIGQLFTFQMLRTLKVR